MEKDSVMFVMLEKNLESPLDSKEIKLVCFKGNQPWIFIGRTDAETEALIPGPPDGRANSLEKTLMLGKIEDRRRRGQQRWLDGITDSMDMNLSQVQEMVKDGEAWRAVVHGVTKSWMWLSDWTTQAMKLWKEEPSKWGYQTVPGITIFPISILHLGNHPPVSSPKSLQSCLPPATKTRTLSASWISWGQCEDQTWTSWKNYPADALPSPQPPAFPLSKQQQTLTASKSARCAPTPSAQTASRLQCPRSLSLWNGSRTRDPVLGLF